MKSSDWAGILSLSTAATVLFASAAQAEDYLTVPEAQKLLFAAAESFSERPTQLTDAQLDEIKDLAGVRQRNEKPKIWKAMDGGKPIGWFLLDEVVGKHEYITFAVGITLEGQVLGIEILSYRETHGGQVRDAGWRKRFAGKSLKDPFKLNRDIPNISGATLSCRNLTDGVKRLLALHKVALRGKDA